MRSRAMATGSSSSMRPSTWIASNDRGWFFSYENICETLEINPEYLRRGLETWRHGAASGARPVPTRPGRQAGAARTLRAAG